MQPFQEPSQHVELHLISISPMCKALRGKKCEDLGFSNSSRRFALSKEWKTFKSEKKIQLKQIRNQSKHIEAVLSLGNSAELLQGSNQGVLGLAFEKRRAWSLGWGFVGVQLSVLSTLMGGFTLINK